jgi:hypothetical protein
MTNKTYRYTVDKVVYNHYLNGLMCYDNNHIFYVDQSNKVKVGDKIEITYSASSNYATPTEIIINEIRVL